MEKPKQVLPRHRGATVKLENGTGGIVDIVPHKDYAEAYKPDWTFRLQTPENIDPKETAPDVPWAVHEIPHVGSSNPIVARLVIQSWRTLQNKLLKNDIKREDLIMAMHGCKDELLACESIHKKLKPEYDAIVKKIEAGDLYGQGKVLTPFPRLQWLEEGAAQFLICIKRALQKVADVFCLCYPPAVVKNAQFQWAIKHLEGRPDQAHYVAFLRSAQLFVTTMVDMRNGLEHPDKGKTHINNFRLIPDPAGKVTIAVPSWHVEGQPETSILDHMPVIIESVIVFAEENFIHCVGDNLNENQFGYRVDEILPQFRDPDCPIRFMLRFGIEQPTEAVKRSMAAAASPEPTGTA
jgi:hypothetical protein